MALPGGVSPGDLIGACKFIYDVCVKYKDAPEKFDEIAEKATNTKFFLNRLQAENDMEGSLVERAGPDVCEQLARCLLTLEGDLEKLKKLVGKYDTIHDNGPGRRLWWALHESSNLTEMRRKIGYHEQNLQLWCTNLMLGSLRRLEGGQEEIINKLKGMPRWELDDIVRALRKHNDPRPLRDALQRRGVPDETIDCNMDIAVDYVICPEDEKSNIERIAKETSQARKSHILSYNAPFQFTRRRPSSSPLYKASSREPGSRYPYYPMENPMPYSRPYPTYELNRERGHEPLPDKDQHEKSPLLRSKSTSNRKLHYDKDLGNYEGPTTKEHKKRSHSKGKDHKPDVPIIISDASTPPKARRSSDTLLAYRPNVPLLVVTDHGPGHTTKYQKEQQEQSERFEHRRTRSSSNAKPKENSDNKDDVVIVVREPERRRSGEGQATTHHRSRSSTDARPRRYEDEAEIVIAQYRPSRRRSESQEFPGTRDSSIHSFYRMREQPTSRGSDRGVQVIRKVTKMDRIDSMPVDKEDENGK